MNDLQPYPAYKDSTIPWLGQIPAHWEVKRGKTIFRPVDIRSVTGEEELLTVSSEHGIVPRRSATVTMFKAESYVGYKLCWPGDLVINSLWAWAKGLGVANYHGIISSAYGVYRPKADGLVDTRFIHELVRSAPFHWELQVRSKGVWTSRLQLTDSAFLDAPFPLPPPEEQAAIARYLDYMDRRIRRYIRAKQQLIKLLTEQKQAIIHQAVTRGLDPDVPLKESGVEWLGQIPEHWEVMRFKLVATVDSALVDPKLNEYREKILIAPNHIERGGTARLLGCETANEQGADSGKYRVRSGQIIYTKIRPYLRKAIIAPLDCLCSADMYPISVRHKNKILPEFLLFIMLSKPFTQYTIDCSLRAAMPKVNREALGEAPVWFPDICEQHSIIEYINAMTGGLDGTLSNIQREIDLIQEYRTRLIADVVTGKVDVRAAATSLPVEMADEASLEEGVLDAWADAASADAAMAEDEEMGTDSEGER